MERILLSPAALRLVSLAVFLCAVYAGAIPVEAAPIVLFGMAQPADSLQIADLKAVGANGLVAEDVLRKIYDISEGIPTPLSDLISESPVKSDFTEWTTDVLGSANADNAYADGADFTPTQSASGSRIGNHTQTMIRGVNVSEATEHSDNFGRTLAYHTMRAIKLLRRDGEAAMLSMNASVLPTTTVAGKLGGLGAYLETNASYGTDGADGGYNTSTKVVDAAASGDTRALTWEMITDQIENCYTLGAMPTVIMSTGAVIKRISRFLLTSNAPAATPTANVTGTAPATQVSQGFVEIVRTDFGYTMKLVPNILQPTYTSDDSTPATNANVFGLSPEYLARGVFWGAKVEPLAKLGLSIRRMISQSVSLKVLNETAHFKVADITPTAAVTAS